MFSKNNKGGLFPLTLAPLGGGQRAPLWFFANSSWSTGNFALKLAIPLRPTIPHLVSKIRTQVIIGQPWVTSEWRYVSPIWTNEMGLGIGNRRHWCSFKATINGLIWNDVELVGLQNCYLGFSKFWKCREKKKNEKISIFFFSRQFAPKSKFSKNRNIC